MNTPDEFRQAVTAAFQQADAVAVAVVEDVGDPPGGWSGTYAAYQQVRYRVKQFTPRRPVGAAPKEITVRHPVVARSRTADRHQPRLDPILFQKGNELVLFLV